MVALRERGYTVHLVDARDNSHPLVMSLWEQGYNLDKGMVVQQGDTITYGAAAMRTLARLSGQRPLLLTGIDALFRWAPLAALLYPVCRGVRRVVLYLSGKKSLRKA
jgi:hypothetical protein